MSRFLLRSVAGEGVCYCRDRDARVGVLEALNTRAGGLHARRGLDRTIFCMRLTARAGLLPGLGWGSGCRASRAIAESLRFQWAGHI